MPGMAMSADLAKAAVAVAANLGAKRKKLVDGDITQRGHPIPETT